MKIAALSSRLDFDIEFVNHPVPDIVKAATAQRNMNIEESRKQTRAISKHVIPNIR
jgi:hypothetical protein